MELKCLYTFSVLSCTSGPLGMESGAILDNSITASSYFSSFYLPQKARLNVGRSDVNYCFDPLNSKVSNYVIYWCFLF